MEKFDYDETFMGASKQRKAKVSFIQDYRLKRLVDFLQIRKGKILDIGCGGGITTESLVLLFPEADIYGCDVSASALNYAKKYGTGKVKYKKISGKKLPFKDNFFDACVALDVMEHVPDLEFFLDEVNRVLKKRGNFFSHTPVEGERFTHTWLWSKIGIGDRMTYKRFGHIHPELTHKHLKKIISKHGFQVTKIRYSEHLFFQLSSLIFYFLPLELLDYFLKKNANLYKDKNVFKFSNKTKKDHLLLLRLVWLKLTAINRYATYLETNLLKEISQGALKSNILAVKK